MKKVFFVSIMLLVSITGFADNRMWIFLSDKGNQAAQSLKHPEKLLSKEARQMRKEKGIAINAEDVPVYGNYVKELQKYDCAILSTSRWLNAVAVEVSDECLSEVQALCFVEGVRAIQTLTVARTGDIEKTSKAMAKYVEIGRTKSNDDAFNYGESREQTIMLKAEKIHKKGISGRGVRVAVFDAGFDGADTIDVFDTLWAQKRIIAWHDFVDNDETLFRNDDHGTNVLSTIAANLPGEMVGMAPHATFILGRTEDSGSETQREEHNWVRAVEWADSIGVDIIHSSLGYTHFDGDIGSYTYKDMDGNTAICTRAADRAAAKGIIVTLSAGNEGGDAWKYIAAPSDADSVLCVGAVGKNGKRAYFSSMGPSSDGQVKPDVMAVGKGTTVASPGNYITTSDGTSFSGPIMGGFMALLRQAHPKRSNMDLIQATRLSGDQYNYPDGEYGYGIPDIMVADSLLRNVKDLSTVKMPMNGKPVRGGDAKPKATVTKSINYTASPKTTFSITGNTLKVNSPENIDKIELRKDNTRVVMNKSTYSVKQKEAEFNLQYLEKGDHYIYIKTNGYEEFIKFTK